MWILNFLPFWIFHLLVILGVLGLLAAAVFKFLPLVSTYRLPIQVVSGLLLLVGIYFQGAISNQEAWEARIKEMEAKVAVAEEKAKQVNEVIKYKFVDKVKVVKDVQVVVQEKIKEVATIIDAKCEVPPQAVELLNSAAKNTKPSVTTQDLDMLNSAAQDKKK